MFWRCLRRGEIDHEALWLGVSLAAGAGAWLWLKYGLPLPQCAFHALTGCPCPTCGATRCVRFVFGGNFGAAFRMNPLAFCALGAATLYDTYAATVLALRLPRLRPDPLPPWLGYAARIAAVTVIAANWAWLLWRGA